MEKQGNLKGGMVVSYQGETEYQNWECLGICLYNFNIWT